MGWRFPLYFSLPTSERSRDKPGRRSPEGVGGGGWRGRRRGTCKPLSGYKISFIYAFRWPSGDFLRWKARTVVSLGGKRESSIPKKEGGESEGCNPGGVVVFKTEMIVCGESESESSVKS